MNARTSPLRATIVVVAFEQERELPRCLSAVCDQSLSRDAYEILVVDNGGNGDARQRCQGLYDRWLEAGDNLGCSGGRNFGARHAEADVLFFVDDDGVIGHVFVAAGLGVLDSDPTAVGVRGRVVPKDHYVLTRLFDGVGDLGPRPFVNAGYEAEGASCVRTGVFLDNGGFDEAITGGEGRDWLTRLKQRQPEAHVDYNPAMVLRHDYVHGVVHLLYKARRRHVAKVRQESVGAKPTLSPAPGTYAESSWRPPVALRIARRIANRSLVALGAVPWPVRKAR